MTLAQNVARFSEAEYLRLERAAETRSEYFDGEIFAMAGGTRSHSLIQTNLAGELSSRLKASDCVAYNNDLRVKVEATGLLTYPDASVVCGEQRFLDEQEDTLLNPTVVIEVLSDLPKLTTAARNSKITAKFPPAANTCSSAKRNRASNNLSGNRTASGP